MARRAPVPMSPPKRVTRARTRTAAGKDEPSKETSKVAASLTATTTAPKRGRPRKDAVPATATSKQTSAPKRRGPKATLVQASDESDSSDDEVNVVTVRNIAKSKSTSSATTSTCTSKRGRNVAKDVIGCGESADDDDELAQPEQPKQKTIRSKNSTSSASQKTKASPSEPANKPSTRRGRKKNSGANAADPKQISAKMVPSGARHPETVPVSTALAKNKPAGNAPKKKVTFLDMTEDSDKENKPLPAPVADKRKTKGETGLRAKPVRRPVTPVSREEEQTSNPKFQSKKDPLSPKTPNKFVKPCSLGTSEAADDADRQKESRTLLKTPQISPMKALNLGPSLASPAKKIDFNATQTSTWPISNQDIRGDHDDVTTTGRELVSSSNLTMMSSPARRLPPSPYKDSMKASPRKAPIAFELTTKSDHKLSSAVKTSPLKESAIKAKDMPLPLQWSISPSQSPIKEKKSFLKSPAKRLMSFPQPFLSPSKNQRCELGGNSNEQDVSLEVQRQDTNIKQLGNIEQHSSGAEHMDCNLIVDDVSEDVSMCCDSVQNGLQEPSRQDALNMTQRSPNQDVKLVTNMEDPFMSPGKESNIFTPMRQYEVTSTNSSANSLPSFPGVPPPAPSPPVFTAGYPSQFDYRDDLADGDSDTESMMSISPSKSPVKRQSIRLVTESDHPENQPSQENRNENVGFTPLVNKLSHWEPAERERKYSRRRGIFSMTPGEDIGFRNVRHSLAIRQPVGRKSYDPRISPTTNETAEFASEDTVIHDQDIARDDDLSRYDECSFTVMDFEEGALAYYSPKNKMDLGEDLPEDFQDDTTDENTVLQEQPTITVNVAMFEETQMDAPENPHSLLPMSVTPVRSRPQYPRTVHTVSKVPLKSEDGALKIPKKRTRSFSSGVEFSSTPTTSRSKTLPSPRKARSPLKPFIPIQQEVQEPPPAPLLPETPKNAKPSNSRSPSKSPRKQPAGHEKVLQGAVVYTDVHTKEGADASGIFVELLTQMGARCVKSWNWNPRASLSPIDGVEPKESKIGITHVIFKDGGRRTLEKVREANGVVKCVGVNWVLEYDFHFDTFKSRLANNEIYSCERSNKWLDEAEYAVDVSMIPRGGQKRRKSMEPRALGNVNGTLVTLDSSTSSAGSRGSSIDLETMQEFMRLSPTPTPQSSRGSSVELDYNDTEDLFSTPKPKSKMRPSLSSKALPETPGYNYEYDYDPATAMSPTTPYYLSQGAKLIQQTCPPKQLRQGLFPASGNIDEVQNESLRMRLELARRRSLIWKPKIGSPLGRQM
ncbi:hypothetical protein PRK78_004994 [Emydomyces testavorans]|uniref:BRCT domain-containing protein n=1 Tax=Emydomyces testavorans TaxID=2070801 RepID=A0AAF0DIW4_9EURO|nr:hypothetical protein PRK78_004994 [Emydomyces testavorans]